MNVDKNEKRWRYINKINLAEKDEEMAILRKTERDAQLKINAIEEDIENHFRIWYCPTCKIFLDSFHTNETFLKLGSIASWGGDEWHHGFNPNFDTKRLSDGIATHSIKRVTRAYELNKILEGLLNGN